VSDTIFRFSGPIRLKIRSGRERNDHQINSAQNADNMIEGIYKHRKDDRVPVSARRFNAVIGGG
jgi:hypothetical protein